MTPLTASALTIETAFGWAWRASWHSAAVVAVVLAARWLAGRRLTPGWRCALWSLVALRLVMPAAPEGRWSVFNLAHALAAKPEAVTVATIAGDSAGGPRVTVGYGPAPTEFAPASTIAPRPATPNEPWRALPLVWLAGVAVVLLRTVVAHRRVRRFVAAARPVSDPAALALLERCRRQAGVARPVRLLATDAVGGPALAGLLRPAILLPLDWCDRLSARQLSFVFLHELAHVKRLDLLGEWLIAGLTALHWFNPLVWLAAHLYRADREAARDAMVLRAAMTPPGGGAAEPREYGDTLLHLAQSVPARRAMVNLLGMVSGRRGLHHRIGQIARFDAGAARRPTAAAIGAALLLIVGACGLTDAKEPAGGADPRNVPPAATRPVIDDGPPDEVLTRVYDLRDLVVVVPDFDADRDFPTTGRRVATTGPILPSPRPLPKTTAPAPLAKGAVPPATTLPTRDELTEQVMTLVRETVAPDSWNAPGRTGAMRALSGQLIVTHRRDVQRQVLGLLEQLRQTRAVQVSVETRFLAFDKAAVDNLPEPLRASVKTALEQGTEKSAGVYLTEAQVNELLRATQASKDATVLTAPRITLFNGQRAYVAVTTQQAYVADQSVVRGKDGKVSYDPVLEVANSGLIMDVQATVSADRRYVTTTLRPRLSNLRRIDTVPFAGVPEDQKDVAPRLTVQRPVVDVRQFKTTVSVPDGGTLLLPGGPLTAGGPAAAAATGPAATTVPVLSDIPILNRLFTNAANPSLIILVRPTVIIQREVEQKQFPLLREKR